MLTCIAVQPEFVCPQVITQGSCSPSGLEPINDNIKTSHRAPASANVCGPSPCLCVVER